MEAWSAHHLYSEALAQHDREKVLSLCDYSQKLSAKGLPVVFTLGHLAKITGVPYKMLRETVTRNRESANYRMYAVRKRAGGRRFIHSVSQDLFQVQQFINQEILQSVEPHHCSYAFHKSGGIRRCAAAHCGAKWLFQYDLKDFFYDINEVDVYQTFSSMGYRSLLSFELARLCTTTHLPVAFKRRLSIYEKEIQTPYAQQSKIAGVLPQGAPSSPMLSNLAALNLDVALNDYASNNGFVYTRYADDITFSAYELPSCKSRGNIHRAIIHRIRKARFKENEKKTRIAGPGSKKVVLGLLVDGDIPRLSREAYRRIDRHLYAAQKFGVIATAEHEHFDSPFGFYNHLSGLVAYVKDVDNIRWKDLYARLSKLTIPWEVF